MFRNPNMRNLGDFLRRNAERYPDREGVISGEARLSWDEINKRSNRLAHSLMDLGVKKGDRVAVILLNCHQWIEMKFAVLKIGAVFVPVNYRLSPEEISIIFNDSGAIVTFYGEEFSSLIQGIKDKCPSIGHRIRIGKPGDEDIAYDDLLANDNDKEPEVEVSLDDLAFISYTGGTTGVPKGAMWLHRNLMDTVQDIPYSFEIAFKSKQLIPVPSYVGGVIIQILNGIYCATTLIFMNFDPLMVLETIQEEKVELMASASVPLFMMASHPEAKKYDLSSLKRIYYGGSSINLKQLGKIQSIFKCELQQGYGGTETLINVSKLEPYDHDVMGDEERTIRVISAGRINKGIELRLIDDEGKDVPLGEVGEIAVKSTSLMAGYWNNPEETEKAFRDGWYLTNDMAYMDEEGYIFIVDRKNDMIKSGGLNVYPAEVEALLLEHPNIVEAAVVSAPDDTWGEKVVAVVVLKEGAPEKEEGIKNFCRGKLGAYKIPKVIDFRKDPFPKTTMGKVKRSAVRDEYWAGYGKKRVY